MQTATVSLSWIDAEVSAAWIFNAKNGMWMTYEVKTPEDKLTLLFFVALSVLVQMYQHI